MKRVDNLLPVVTEDSNFGKAGRAFYVPGRFDVNDTIHRESISGHLIYKQLLVGNEFAGTSAGHHSSI